MKKFLNTLVCALLVVTMFLGAASTANAENVECNHDEEYLMWDYAKYDGKHHLLITKCMNCGYEYSTEEMHDWLEYYNNYDYKDVDDEYHEYLKRVCQECGETTYVKEKHDWWGVDEGKISYIDNNYHEYTRKVECSACSLTRVLTSKEAHSINPDNTGFKVIKKATLTSKGKISYRCEECGQRIYKYVKFWPDSDYSKEYDITHNSVLYNDKYVIVHLKNPSKGAVVKLKVGKNRYEQKIKNDKKTVKIKIKKPKCGQKITMYLYYKGRIVGYDRCSDNLQDMVRYAKHLRRGMTKTQVKYTWGNPKKRTSGSKGYSNWYYQKGSYVKFKNGKVIRWHKAS